MILRLRKSLYNRELEKQGRDNKKMTVDMRALVFVFSVLFVIGICSYPIVGKALDLNYYKVEVVDTSGIGIQGAKVSISYYEQCEMKGYSKSEDGVTNADGMTDEIPSHVTRYKCVRVSVLKDGYLTYSKQERMKNSGGKVIRIVLHRPEEGPYR